MCRLDVIFSPSLFHSLLRLLSTRHKVARCLFLRCKIDIEWNERGGSEVTSFFSVKIKPTGKHTQPEELKLADLSRALLRWKWSEVDEFFFAFLFAISDDLILKTFFVWEFVCAFIFLFLRMRDAHKCTQKVSKMSCMTGGNFPRRTTNVNLLAGHWQMRNHEIGGDTHNLWACLALRSWRLQTDVLWVAYWTAFSMESQSRCCCTTTSEVSEVRESEREPPSFNELKSK